MPPKPDFKRVSGNLNVVLTNKELNQVLKQVLGPKGQKLGPVAIASDYCCVDASVGSSVAGPVSSVASSVSYPGPGERMRGGALMKSKVTHADIRRKIVVPKNAKVR